MLEMCADTFRSVVSRGLGAGVRAQCPGMLVGAEPKGHLLSRATGNSTRKGVFLPALGNLITP